MKTSNILPFLCSLLFSVFLFSQSNINQTLSVNSSGNAADPSAQFDVSATDKGMLVPRMTTAQRTMIALPATGLLVFDTTTGSFYFFNGTAWVDLSSPKVLADADDDTKIQVEESPDEDVIRFDLAGTESLVLQKNAGGSPRLELPNSQFNTFVGLDAGFANASGIWNTAFGAFALNVNTTGYSNTATGRSAMASNTTGHNNTASGVLALSSNNTGYFNTANGVHALLSNTSGYNNTAAGVNALSSNTTGFNNTAVGVTALSANTMGFSNTANGQNALINNTTGFFNTATGTTALSSNTIGNYNTATGVSALSSNTIGIENTAHGAFALTGNTQGYNNVATGVRALFSNADGFENTATGHLALYSNTSGFKNTATGESALYSNTSGNSNAADGFEALFNNTIGSWNVGFGRRTLFSNTIGIENTAGGVGALFSNTTGNSNTACGFDALKDNTTGSENTAFGYRTLLDNSTGNFNTAIGVRTYFTAAGLSNTTCLGYFTGGIVNASNRIEIGNTSVSWIGGQVNWGTYSDARIKTQVQENVPGLDFIKKLRPVTYHLDIQKQNEMCFRGKKEEAEWEGKYDIEQKQMTGFIAQEVEAAAKAVGYDFSGVEKGADEVGMYSVKYAEFVVPLVKAVQEQQVIIDNGELRIENLETENTALKAELQVYKSKLEKITAALQGAGIAVEK